MDDLWRRHKVRERPPPVCIDGDRLEIITSTDDRAASCQATEDVPLVLLEVAATEPEAHPATLDDDRTDLGVLDPSLFEKSRRAASSGDSPSSIPPPGRYHQGSLVGSAGSRTWNSSRRS